MFTFSSCLPCDLLILGISGGNLHLPQLLCQLLGVLVHDFLLCCPGLLQLHLGVGYLFHRLTRQRNYNQPRVDQAGFFSQTAACSGFPLPLYLTSFFGSGTSLFCFLSSLVLFFFFYRLHAKWMGECTILPFSRDIYSRGRCFPTRHENKNHNFHNKRSYTWLNFCGYCQKKSFPKV